MSTAAAASPAPAADAPPPAPRKGMKKLIILVAAVLLLVLGGGGGAYFMLKKKAVADDEDAADGAPQAEQKATKRDPKSPPAYFPLDMFTVNLADRESERYAQIGITLELAESKDADQFKLFLPAVRNNILLVLAQKTAADLLDKEGKVKLAGQVQRAASRAVGVEVDEPVEAVADDDEARPAKKKSKARKKVQPALPVVAVHFSNFIVQ